MDIRHVDRAPLAFIGNEAMIMHPVLFPLWAGGLLWLLFGRDGRRYRLLGWTFVGVLALFIALKGKNYYVSPVYPMLFAAGAIGLERITVSRRWTSRRPPYALLAVR